MAGLDLPPDAVRCSSKDDIKTWLVGLEPYQNGNKKPSRGQVMRDYALWFASGRNKCVLAHGNKGSSRKSIFDEILVDIINDVIETYWGPNPDLSLENVQSKIADEVGLRFAEGELEIETIPSLATIARYRKKLDNYLLVQLREGVYEADLQHQPKGKILIPDFPHSRWEVDHSLLPVRVAFEFKDENGEPPLVPLRRHLDGIQRRPRHQVEADLRPSPRLRFSHDVAERRGLASDGEGEPSLCPQRPALITQHDFLSKAHAPLKETDRPSSAVSMHVGN
jgi:hypothetical protein